VDSTKLHERVFILENNLQKPVTARSVKMIAVITQNKTGAIHGKLDCDFFEEPFIFTSIVRMIGMMETTFDTKGFPEKQLLPRTYGKAKKRLSKNRLDLQAHIKKNSAVITQPDTGGNKCAFEIIVGFRHNAEWQGRVQWIEKNITKEFSSVVELTRLIDMALSSV